MLMSAPGCDVSWGAGHEASLTHDLNSGFGSRRGSSQDQTDQFCDADELDTVAVTTPHLLLSGPGVGGVDTDNKHTHGHYRAAADAQTFHTGF